MNVPAVQNGGWDLAEPLLRIADVCQLLQISRGTVYGLIRRGELVPIRVGTLVRFSPRDVREYLDRSREA